MNKTQNFSNRCRQAEALSFIHEASNTLNQFRKIVLLIKVSKVIFAAEVNFYQHS